MAATRWSLLELVQRTCAKLNAPKPSSLSASALADSAFHDDLVDALHDAAHRLMLRLNPEELFETVVLRTTPVSDIDATVIANNDAVTWDGTGTDSVNAASWAFPILCMQDTEGIYELSSISGTTTMSATMDRTWTGDSGTEDAYVGTREIALPADFKQIRERLYNVTDQQRVDVITLNQLEEMRRTHPNVDVISLSPGTVRYVTVTRDGDGNAYLMCYPVPEDAQDIRIPYIKMLDVYDASTDDATSWYFPIPPHHQNILIDSVVVEVLGHQLADGQENRAYYDAMKRLSQSIADIDGESDASRNQSRVEPVTYRGGRRLFANGRYAKTLPIDFDRDD